MSSRCDVCGAVWKKLILKRVHRFAWMQNLMFNFEHDLLYHGVMGKGCKSNRLLDNRHGKWGGIECGIINAILVSKYILTQILGVETIDQCLVLRNVLWSFLWKNHWQKLHLKATAHFTISVVRLTDCESEINWCSHARVYFRFTVGQSYDQNRTVSVCGRLNTKFSQNATSDKYGQNA